MESPRVPDNEIERLAALHALNLLDTPPEERFDRITRVAQAVFDVPYVLISLVDKDRQWFKSKQGLDLTETPRDISFCGHAILNKKVFVVPNATHDLRFADNPLVAGDLKISFYAGAVLSAPNGAPVGTLCLIDQKPKELTPQQTQTLCDLGKLVENELATIDIQSILAKLQEAQCFFDVSMDLLCSAGFDGYFKRLNAKWRDVFGYSIAELKAQPFGEFVHPEDREQTAHEVAKLSKGQVSINFENRYRTKAGDYRWLSWNATGVIGKSRIFAAARDVTEHKKSADDLRLAHDKAIEAIKTKSVFLANMSHEIRTPLNGIIGMIDLSLDANPSQEIKHWLDQAKTSSHHLLRLISDILDFSKIEAEKLTLISISFNLKEVIDSAIKMVQPNAAKKNLTITANVDRNMPTCYIGDPDRLRQILVNILGNAIKFTEVGGVSVHATGAKLEGMDLIQFKISDTGIGVPKERQKDIFESFTQADSSISRRFGGTGLGTTISKQLVEMMHGQIEVISPSNDTNIGGPGTTFCFSIQIPISEENQDGKTADQATKKSATESRSEKILLAEDNLINQQVAITFLRKAGFDVSIANDGKEALAAAQTGEYAVIFMDMQMPHMDGLEATKQIRIWETDRNEHIPIIAMTANAMDDDKDRCINAGMDDYMSKPYKRDTLIGLVNKYLHRD